MKLLSGATLIEACIGLCLIAIILVIATNVLVTTATTVKWNEAVLMNTLESIALDYEQLGALTNVTIDSTEYNITCIVYDHKEFSDLQVIEMQVSRNGNKMIKQYKYIVHYAGKEK